MTRAHEALAIDEAVADPAAVVRASIVDHDELTAPESRDRELTSAIARRHDRTNRDVPDFGEREPTVVRVVAQLVEHTCMDRTHATNVGRPSDSASASRVRNAAEFLIPSGIGTTVMQPWLPSWSTSISTASSLMHRH